MMEQLQLDLNLIKKEPQYFEDYGQSAGNILDNIIPEPDFDQFGHAASSVPNSEDMDQGVDWLSSFFDEPNHETCNVNGLNPPISKLSDIPLSASASYPSVVKILGSNPQNGLLSDTLNVIPDEYSNDMIYKSPNSVRPPSSPDPFLGPTHGDTNATCMSKETNEPDLISALRKAQNFKVLSQVDRQTLNLTTARELIQRLKYSQQNNHETLREQRLGHVQNQRVSQRNCNGNDLFNTIIKKEAESNDSDSGYESPSQLSPGCINSSPTVCPQGTDYPTNAMSENIQNCDQSKDRAPFYLSEEERRTLITEGLPIPTSTPLSKAEERALKKVRRKIKNKISAQESRRKKKEYMEALEKKIEIVSGSNTDLRKKVETLEIANKSLIMQLQKLQASIAVKSVKEISTRATQTTHW